MVSFIVGAAFDDAGPFDDHWHAEATFRGGAFFALEGSDAAVWPRNEWLVGFVSALDEVQAIGEEIFVSGFHALARHRASVFDLTVGSGADHTAWAVFFLKGRMLRVVVTFGFFFRIQVVEIAVEFVEPVCCWQQVLVLVAKVIFAVLSGHVAFFFK